MKMAAQKFVYFCSNNCVTQEALFIQTIKCQNPRTTSKYGIKDLFCNLADATQNKASIYYQCCNLALFETTTRFSPPSISLPSKWELLLINW